MTAPLKEHRQRAFLSTRELAEKANVAPDTIWRIEGGNYKQLRPATMRRIAQALGIHPSEVTEFISGAMPKESRRDGAVENMK